MKPLEKPTIPMPKEQRIRSLIEYLKYDYAHDRIDNYYYLEYLSLLRDTSTDKLTQFKLDRMMGEIPI